MILMCFFILQRPEEGLEHQEIMPIVSAPDKVGNYSHIECVLPGLYSLFFRKN